MKRKKESRVLGTVFRAVELARDAVISEDERLVKISFSSEAPVMRASFFEKPWIEILGHDSGEMNTARLDAGATVHYNHSRSRADRVGVVESGSTKNQRGEAIVRFSKNERVNDIWDDVKDGVLRNVSVGYSIDKRVLVREGGKGEPDEYRVTRWTPHELSFVDIPADHTVGVGRNLEAGYMVRDGGNEPVYRIEAINETLSEVNDDMKLQRLEGETDEALAVRQAAEDARVAALNATPAPAPTPEPAPVVDIEGERSTARAEGQAEGQRLEQERRTGIETAVAPFEKLLGERFATVRDHCVSENLSVDDARAYILGAIGTGQEPVGGDVASSSARVVETGGEAFMRGATNSLLLRAKLIDPNSEAGREVRKDAVAGYSLPEMARKFLELKGIETSRLGKMEMIGRAFTSSDFPLLLQDAANKSLLKGFEESPETWQIWAQTGDLSDFKIGNRPGLSSFDDLQLVSENGEFVYGSFTEQRNTIQLATYGKLFAITRQAIINDDLSAFTTIPSRMGRAASRLVGDLAYGVITANPVMGDGIAFFNAAHNNLNQGAGAPSAITAVSVGEMRNAMALQTDASGSATGLNIRPSFLLAPLALEDTAAVLMASETDPVSVNSRVPNPVRNLAQVVTDPRLDADSLTRWYMSASAMFDTIEVAFLDGVQAPTLEQQMGWSIDGTEYKVRIDVGAAPMEFRTWQRNDGA